MTKACNTEGYGLKSGHVWGTATTVDVTVTVIGTHSAIHKADKASGPEMHQSRKVHPATPLTQKTLRLR
jgi:hypothetical protein